MADADRSVRWQLGLGLLLAAASAFELRAFLADGLPLFFDAHSHLTRVWLAARALAAGCYPSWTFAWYGGYRLFEFYAPAYYWLTAGLGLLAGDFAAATRAVLFTGQLVSVVAFYAVLLRLGAAPLTAAFGALLFLYDAERWRLLAVIGNHPSVFVYALAPLLMLAALRTDGTRRASVHLFAGGALLMAAMAAGHLTNTAQALPALLVFALAAGAVRLPRRAAARTGLALAAAVAGLAVLTSFLTVPMWRGLPLVSLSLDARPRFELEPVWIALGWAPGSLRRIFVVSLGAFWCALALGAGLLSALPRFARWRACAAGLFASLLSVAALGERAAMGLIFFVAALSAAALEEARRAVAGRAGARAALALEALALAAVPVWHHLREETPLRTVDPAAFAVYQRIPGRGEPGRTFDVTPATDSVDGVYGQSSFSPYWTGRAIPFGGFPQGAPLAVNVQLALAGELVQGLAAPQPELSAAALDLLRLLDVEWLVDRGAPPRLARLSLAPGAAERREPGLLRLPHASPALFAPRLERLAEAPLARLEARWAADPLRARGERSLDALSRTGTRRDQALFLPLLRGMEIARDEARAERFFVEREPPGGGPAAAPEAGAFEVLTHREGLAAVEIRARAGAPGFVRLAYSFDPALRVALDGEPVASVPDFLGGVVLAFPSGTHDITLAAPRATLRLALLVACGALAVALGIVWALSRPRGGSRATQPEQP